jgi:hypothetical protein
MQTVWQVPLVEIAWPVIAKALRARAAVRLAVRSRVFMGSPRGYCLQIVRIPSAVV